MRIGWLLFTNLDFDRGYSGIVPLESRCFPFPGTFAIQEAFSCISKFAGALLFWIYGGQDSTLPRKLSSNSHGSHFGDCQSCKQGKHMALYRNTITRLKSCTSSRAESVPGLLFSRIVNSTVGNLWKEVEHLESLPILSLAAAFVPPFKNLSSSVFAIPLENTDEIIDGQPCKDGHRKCSNAIVAELSWKGDAIEPRTGIKFPTILEARDNNFNPPTKEVLVGVGYRSIRVVKFKSLKLYAFGLYVQPDSICEKLGPKYGSIPISELKKREDFFEDLLREDIHMTVRLVVNYNGLKVDTVKDAFEKSLRARLLKVNPNTDYVCLMDFGSSFTQKIPLHVGTMIDFRQTSKGQLITEIDGKQFGAVHSKDLCRAFFDMYIGDVPISATAKQEIAGNVASIIKKC